MNKIMCIQIFLFFTAAVILIASYGWGLSSHSLDSQKQAEWMAMLTLPFFAVIIGLAIYNVLNIKKHLTKLQDVNHAAHD